MMNCSFNQFKDLVGIHQVIFDSLLSGSDLNTAVKNLSGYLDNYSEDFKTFDSDRLEEFANDLENAIKIGLDIFQNFNTEHNLLKSFDSDYATFGVGNNIIGNTIAKYLPEGVSTKRDDISAVENSFLNTLEPSSNVPDSLNAELENTAVTTADNVHIQFRNPNPFNKDVDQIKTRFYSGVPSSFNSLKEEMWETVFNEIVLPMSLGEIKGIVGLNDAIKSIKNDLFKRLLDDPQGVNYFSDDKYNSQFVKNTLDGIQNEYLNHNKDGLTVADVRKMSLNPAYAKDLEKYNAFVTLKYFDDLIGEFSSGKIVTGNSFYGVETNMNKYLPLMSESNARKTFREDDVDVSGLTQLSDFYEGFIGNMRVLDMQGRETTMRLDPMTVAYTLSRYRQNINLYDSAGSLKQTIQESLRKYLSNTAGTDISLTDAKVLLTLYNNVFKSSNTVEAIKNDLGITKENPLFKKLTEVTGRNSLMDNFSNYLPTADGANLFEAVVSDMTKLDPVSYSEVSIDFATGTLHRKTFLSRESDTQFYILKSLGNFASQQTKHTLDRTMNKNGARPNSYSITQEGTLFKLKTSSGKTIAYDVYDAEYVDAAGVRSKSFPSSSIKVPPINMSLQNESMTTLKRDFPDYMEIVSMFDNLLKQPLASQNFNLLDMFREMSDFKDGSGAEVHTHLDVMTKMAGNFSFLSHLNAAPDGVNGRVNGKLADIKTGIEKGQTSLGVVGTKKFDIKDLWDARNNTFKLELSQNSKGGYGAMKEYARVLNNYYNTSIKSVTMNSDGNALPTYILATMMNRVHQITGDVKANIPVINKYYTKDGSPVTVRKQPVFRNNIFVTNNNLINSIDINAGIKNKDGETSSSGKMSLIELATASIDGNFLDSFLNDGITSYQTTNFSDKGKHSTVTIDRKGNFTYLTGDGRTVTKAWNKMSISEFKDAYFASIDSYYDGVFNNVVGDYNQIFNSDTNAIQKSLYASSDYLQLVPMNENGELGTPDKVLLADKDFKNDYDNYKRVVKALNAAGDLTKLKNKKYQATAINDVLSLMSMGQVSDAFAIAGVDFVDALHVNKSQLTESPYFELTTINDNLLDSATKYREGLDKREQEIRDKFIKSLKTMDYTMDLRDSDGTENAGFKRYLYQLSQTNKVAYNKLVKNFIDTDFGRMKIEADGVLHPMLEQYLWENLLVGRNFQLLTVGSALEHPAKGVKRNKDNQVTPGMLESAKLTAQNKRMVILQASMHPVMLNTLKGLGGITRSIIVKDPGRSVSTAYGKEGFVDVTDGATFSNPIHTLLFGESLMGEHSGHGVKSIRGEMDPMTGVAVLLKHAEYGITNLNILRGYDNKQANQFLQLMKRTMSENFTDIYGHDVGLDITKDYNDTDHTILEDADLHFVYSDRLAEHFQSVEVKPGHGDLIQVNSMVKNPNGTYTIQYTNKTTDQKFLSVKPIDNLYDLWRSLGGEQSVTKLDSEVGKFEKHANTVLDGFTPSMSSTNAVKDFVNTVGVKLSSLEAKLGKEAAKNVSKQYRNEELRGATSSNPEYMNQLTVIQPLKNSLIGQVSFKSAVKVGAGNPVSLKQFMSPDAIPVNRHSATFYGMQLNAEHAVGADSKVIEQSQIITALSFVGTSPEHATKAFDAIQDYISGRMLTLMPAITGMKNDVNQKNELKRIMRKIISNSLGTKDITGMTSAVVEAIKAEMDVNGAPLFNIPVSAPDLYNTVFTTLSNFLTAEGIRRNLPGLAAVLKPNNGFMGVRNTYTRDAATGELKVEVLMEENYDTHALENPERLTRLNYAENPNFNVELLNTVIETIGDREVSHYLDDVGKYLDVKARMKANPSAFQIDLEAKREMKATGFSWDVIDSTGEKTNMNHYDLPVSMLGNIGKSYIGLASKLEGNRSKLKLNKLKAHTATLAGQDESLINAFNAGNAILEADIKTLEKSLAKMSAEYQNLIDLSGINDVIEQLNTVTTLERSEDGTVLTDALGNVKLIKDTSNEIIKPFTMPELKDGGLKDISKAFKLNGGRERLIKNILNKQLAVINEGYSKPSVFDIPKLITKMDTTNVFSNTGAPLGTLAEHVERQRAVLNDKGIVDPTIYQLIGSGDVYIESGVVTTHPGEIMASNIYKDRLGLSEKHTPGNVTVDTMFRNLERKTKPTTNLQDLFAINGKGEHTYIVFEGSKNHSELIKKHNLRTNDNVRIAKDPLTDTNHIYDAYGNKKEKVPYDKLYIADINNNVKNYIVVPKNEELGLAAMLKSNGGVFNSITPNFSTEANLNKIHRLVSSGVLKTNARTAAALEKLSNEMRSYQKAYAKADARGKVKGVLDTLNYYDYEWAQLELGDVQEASMLAKSGSSKRKNLDKLAENIRTYMRSYNEYTAAAPDAKDSMRAPLMDMIKEIVATDRGDAKQRIIASADNAMAATATALADLQTKHYDYISNQNKALAQRQYSAFRMGLNIAAARIPGQHFQSFMGQRIIGFTNDEHNIAYVSTTHMLITGEDFDIDKAYLTYYGLNRDGVMPGWTKYWADNTPEHLEASLNLPLSQSVRITGLRYVDSLLALNAKDLAVLTAARATIDVVTDENGAKTSTKLDKQLSALELKRLARALNKIAVMNNRLNKFDDSPLELILRPELENTIDTTGALDFIDYYFNQSGIDASDNDYEAGYANAITSGIVNTGNDVRNTNIQLSPVDFGEFGDLAETSVKGVEMKSMSYENPLDIYAAQVYAMVGKDVIAIAASSGLKPFGTLAYNFTHIKNRGIGPEMNMLNKNKNDGLDYLYNMISTVSLNDPLEVENVVSWMITNIYGDILQYTPEQLNKIQGVREALTRSLTRNNMLRIDAALELSGILSAATDNAKELILGRINAGAATAGYYLAGSILHKSAQEIGDLMMHPTAEAALKLADRNLFKGRKMTFEGALAEMASGNLNLKPYMTIDVAYSLTERLKDASVALRAGQKKFNNIDEYLTASMKGVAPKDIADYLEKLKRTPYAYVMAVLNGNTAKSVGVDLEDVIELVLENSKSLTYKKAVGISKDTKLTKPSFAKMTEADLDEGFDDIGGDDYNFDNMDAISDFDGFDYDGQAFDEDIMSDFLGGDEFGDLYKAKQIPGEVMINRYLADVRTYMGNVNTDIIVELAELEPLKKDLETLGKFASVNQGVKNTFFDLYQYGSRVKNYLIENFPDYMTANSDRRVTDIMDDYHNNKEFKEYLDGLFRVSQDPAHRFTSNINLLSLLFNTGHMSAMQNISFKAAQWNDNISIKTRMMQDMADNSGVKLSRKNYGILQNYANDALIVDVLSRIGDDAEQDVLFNAYAGQMVNPLEGEIKQTYYPMDIRTVEGRDKFLSWFETTVIPELQQGRTTLSDGSIVNIDTENNAFLKSLTIDSKMDRRVGERYHYYTVRMDTNKRTSTKNLILHDVLIDEFASLRDLKFNGKKLTDLFFLYNLFIFKGRNTKGSLGSFLNVVSDGYQNDSLMSKFMNRLGWLDNETQNRGESLYSLEELYNKGYATDTVYIPDVYKGPALKKLDKDADDKFITSVYKWVWKPGTKETVMNSSEGAYVKLDLPKYNERTISVTAERNYTDGYKSRVQEEIVLRKLEDLIKNNFETKIKENC